MIIYAVNIHTGGGKVLLDELLHSTPQSDLDCIFVDQRYKLPQFVSIEKIVRVKPKIASRLFSEFRLLYKSRGVKKVLMFGNLPPLFRLRCDVVLYFQNLLLIPDICISSFPMKTKVRILAERLWIQSFKRNIDSVWVQTEYVRDLVTKLFKKQEIHIKPVIPHELVGEPKTRDKEIFKYDFIYVASTEPHKNLKAIVETWTHLKNNKLLPKLLLVLNGSTAALEVEVQQKELLIDVKTNIQRNELMLLYRDAQYLLYPSLLESFGLPILEAKKEGLKILASDLPYARSLKCVDYYFDPNNPKQIADLIAQLISK